ncbi:MAG: NAD(P)(+) transhydrogenase (Re/Si-specific) subunit beta, partial [Bacteroidota bacterium]
MTHLVNLGYLAGVICFILGLRQLSTPKTARKGNLLAAVGMGIAILVTLFLPLEKGADNYLLIFVALAIGSAIGLVASKRVAMTDMPQMVSVFNGLGGACAVAISVVELINYQSMATPPNFGIQLTTYLAMWVGA